MSILTVLLLSMVIARPMPHKHSNCRPPTPTDELIYPTYFRSRERNSLHHSNGNDSIVLANVPRSGSTWLFHVLRASNPPIHVKSVHHWPFSNATIHYEISARDSGVYTIVLMRNPLTAYRSYRKLWPTQVDMKWKRFLGRWMWHHQWWSSQPRVTFLCYETLSTHPKETLGPWLWKRLQYGFREWSHKDWCL